MSERRTTLLATLALLGMTATWGSTFFLIKDLLDRVPVLDFLAVRFAIATVALWLMFPRALAKVSPERWRPALVLVVGLVRSGASRDAARPEAAGYWQEKVWPLTPRLSGPSRNR